MSNNDTFTQVFTLLTISISSQIELLSRVDGDKSKDVADLRTLAEMLLDLVNSSEELVIASIEACFESELAKMVDVTRGVMNADFDPKIQFANDGVLISPEEYQVECAKSLSLLEKAAVDKQIARFAAMRQEVNELLIRIGNI